jgi:hypothetical protein
MSVEIEFAKNDRVVVAKYSGQMTAAHMITVVNSLNTTLERTSLPIHNITDLSQATAFPANMLSVIRGLQKILRHPMMGTFVIVTSTTFYHVMINAIVRVFPFLKIRVVNTLPEAWAEIDSLLAAETQV